MTKTHFYRSTIPAHKVSKMHRILNPSIPPAEKPCRVLFGPILPYPQAYRLPRPLLHHRLAYPWLCRLHLPCRQQPLRLLHKPVQKGQKTALASGRALNAVHVCFGWNTSNPQCDVDVSAFLLDGEGKVPGDSWFVFYGQTSSPDQSVTFRTDDAEDREIMDIRFQKLNPAVKKIVFVLTINDAFEKNLNFGMMKDAYIRILDDYDRTELVSFRMTDYYTNVISMMIGEIYLHNNTWKFNAIGNGVARDLAGLCTLYGVEVSN